MNSIVIYNDPNLFSQPLFHKGPQFFRPDVLGQNPVILIKYQNTRYGIYIVQLHPFWIACVQAALRSSSDTLITARPLSLKSSYSFTILGFSIRQGPHHEAQKSMIFNFPFTLYSDTCPPSGVGKVKSGAWAAIYYK